MAKTEPTALAAGSEGARNHSVIPEASAYGSQELQAPTTEFFERVERDEKLLQNSLRQFASHAFRRPVTDEELASYVEYAKGTNYRSAVKALLCSPNFIYLNEKPGALEPFALASRLSYFLWNSTPDNTLLRHAASGDLAKPEVLVAEVNRMLADEKSKSFVSRFVHQWLGLENMTDMPADKKYVYYHDLFVGDLMVEETNHFIRDMIATQRSPIADVFPRRLHVHEFGPCKTLWASRCAGRKIRTRFAESRSTTTRLAWAGSRSHDIGQRNRHVAGDSRHLGSGQTTRHATRSTAG